MSDKTLKTRRAQPPPHPLVAEAISNPFRLFTAKEMKFILGKSINFVLAAKNAGAPFHGGVTRPEWVLDWLKNHPDFVVKNHAAASKSATRGTP